MSRDEADRLRSLLDRLRGLEGPPAWELLEEAARADPRDPRPMLLLGAQLISHGLVERAESAFRAALDRSPDFAIARFQLGLLQMTAGRPSEATATWRPLERLGKGDPLCLFKRGLEALAMDRFEEASALLHAGKTLNTQNEPLNRDMQNVLDAMARAGLLRSGEPLAAGSEPRAASTGEEPTRDGHVLLSTYGRGNAT